MCHTDSHLTLLVHCYKLYLQKKHSLSAVWCTCSLRYFLPPHKEGLGIACYLSAIIHVRLSQFPAEITPSLAALWFRLSRTKCVFYFLVCLCVCIFVFFCVRNIWLVRVQRVFAWQISTNTPTALRWVRFQPWVPQAPGKGHTRRRRRNLILFK